MIPDADDAAGRAARRAGTAPVPRRVEAVVEAAERHAGAPADALAAIRLLHRGLGMRRVLLGAVALALSIATLLLSAISGVAGALALQLLPALLLALLAWSNARMVRAWEWWMRRYGSLRGLGADDPDAARLFAFEPFVFWRAVGGIVCVVLGLTGAASAAVAVRDPALGAAFAVFGIPLLIAGIVQLRALARIVAVRLAAGRTER
ncbi:hypothetical protein [Schumannella sp. 10F1B-5-1]|uniref:hypothetical protein n=1 Tax=Schumannella sp. 10F1B-5-1 TaxID=2590780 RepID=UPI001130A28D|nr:hypothetical protein [Schumannella sp. 10F1B-5-1]TPW72320.1 hypothetical protein FJ658_08610 [Schumannella sp. 10F1B-5-1]